ncbi:unnamed protein product [Macrosiphum euphorbiae]|uniref:Uncharacterized protein n=1 Tax=Macrosiphum euphorbiae TaxID=13131 RepID=A0AAV0WPS8_9HEMI|nr:unnamed protein product [Macrosiphum euphorbiae]
MYRSNKLSARPGGAGRRRFSRPLQRFMRLGTVAKKLFATELAAAAAAVAVVSKIRLNLSVRVSVCACATIVQLQRPSETMITRSRVHDVDKIRQFDDIRPNNRPTLPHTRRHPHNWAVTTHCSRPEA